MFRKGGYCQRSVAPARTRLGRARICLLTLALLAGSAGQALGQPPGKPGTPQLTAGGRGTTTLTIHWTAPESTHPILRYNIGYTETGSGTRKTVRLCTTDANDRLADTGVLTARNCNQTVSGSELPTSWTIEDLASGVGYTIFVRAFSIGGRSENSATFVTSTAPNVTVQFGQDTYTATEGEPPTSVTVTLSVDPKRTVVVPLTTTPLGGATTADYSGVPATVTFQAGETSQSFGITATQDSVDDDGESLQLGFGTLPTGVPAGAPAMSTVGLEDDEGPPTVTLHLDPASISEDRGVSTVTATLSHASNAPTTITVSATPVAPAVAGDFTLSATTLTIPAGTTTSTGSVTLTAVDNALAAPDKTITVAGTATNSQGVTGPEAVTLTITDDEGPPTVTLHLDPASISENGDVSTVTATLNHASDEPTTITVSATPVAPAVASDFTLSTNRTLTIAAGSTTSTGSVTLTAVDNALAAPNKTITVAGTATNSQGVTGPEAVTLTITDDEETPPTSDLGDGAPTTSVPPGRVPVPEPDGPRTIELEPGEDPPPVRVRVSVVDQERTVTLDMQVAPEVSPAALPVLTFPPLANLPLTPTSQKVELTIGPRSGPPLSPPTGFRVGASPTVVDITLTLDGQEVGPLAAPVTVCLPYDPTEPEPPELFHNAGAGWVSLPAQSVQSESVPPRVCGQTQTFSDFGVFYQAAPVAPAAQQWLARVGRSLAGAAVEVIGQRMAAAPGRSSVTLGGQRLTLGQNQDDGPTLTTVLETVGRALGLPTTSGEPTPGYDPGWRDARFQALAARQTGLTLPSGRQWLSHSGFQLSLTGNGASEPGPWTLWGQGHFTRFEGQAGETLDVDGDVTAAYLGVDYRWGPRGLAGVAVSHTRGTGGFRQPAWRGDLDATVTSVHPYAQVALTERLSVWGTLGYGRGELEVTDPNNAQNALTTDVAMRLAAVGVRGALPAMGGVAWTLKADGFLVQMDTEARVAFPETTADAQRLRLVLAGQRPWALAAGARLVPSLELGTRYDGGDAERGLGAEVGGGLRYTHPGWGLEVAARGRYLLVHQEAAFEQWSASLTAQVQPPDGSGKGVSVTLAPAWGPTASGVAGLWAGPTIGGVVPPGARTRPGGRLTAEVGYGLTAFDTGLLTPYAGTALTEGATRTFRVGTRLRVPRRGASALTLTLEGTRQEATGPRPVNQGLQLQVTGGF